MMIVNLDSSNLDLTIRDNQGETGFNFAEKFGKVDIVNLIKKEMPSIAF